ERISVAPPSHRRRGVAEELGEDPLEPELAGLVLEDAPGAAERWAEVRERDCDRVLPAVEVALRVEDLRRGARGIGVEPRQLGPAVPSPELMDEAEALGVGERQELPEEPRGPAEHRPGRGGQDRPLDGHDVRELAEVAGLAVERPVEGERDGLALDQGLAGERLIAL